MRAIAVHEDVIVVIGAIWKTTSTAVRAGDEAFLIDSPILPEELDALPALPEGRSGGPAMIEVPAGRYTVGSGASEPYDNEHPCHQVELAGRDLGPGQQLCPGQLMVDARLGLAQELDGALGQQFLGLAHPAGVSGRREQPVDMPEHALDNRD